jgi:hypothetical protein
MLPFFEVTGLHIPSDGGQLDDEAIELFGHFDLTSKSGGLGQAKS